MAGGRVTAWVERHPAVAHFLLAMTLGMIPIGVVVVANLSPAFDQLGALSGSAAGLLLAALLGGRRGLTALLRRGLIWRVGAGWWVFALAFPALVTLAALLIGSRIGGAPLDWRRLGSLGSLVGTVAFLIVAAGVGEEFGWRGFALPRVQARRTALAASLIVGTLHSLWHTPLFFLPGVSQYDIAQQAGFWPAFLGHTILIVTLGVQMAWIFNHTRGSVLLVAVYHGAINGWNGYLDVYRGQLIGVWVYVALMVAVSIVLVIRDGPADLSRTGSRIRVGPGADRP